MHEVEVKASVQDLDALIEALSALGCEMGPEIFQDDTVYARNIASLDEYLRNDDFLRLRVENDRTLFTFKHHPYRAANEYSAPLEHEVEVSSRDALEQMLLIMGYREAVRIRKRRRKGRYLEWEVRVDEVEGLGSFIELEELVPPDADVEAIQKKMTAFLKELGLDPLEQRLFRYDILLLQKNA